VCVCVWVCEWVISARVVSECSECVNAWVIICLWVSESVR
jgi:hypothetical protein